MRQVGSIRVILCESHSLVLVAICIKRCSRPQVLTAVAPPVSVIEASANHLHTKEATCYSPVFVCLCVYLCVPEYTYNYLRCLQSIVIRQGYSTEWKDLGNKEKCVPADLACVRQSI